MLLLSPQQIRLAEHDANQKGLSFADMMENAGRGCAQYIEANITPCRTAILCGGGKNGGDGYVIARHLAQHGFCVTVHNLGNGNDALSASMRAKMPDTIQEDPAEGFTDAKLIIDAVFGIGFHGQLPENIKNTLVLANECEAVRIAVDIPSGLSEEYQDGEPYFHADETLTMLCYKPVHAYKPFSEKCGKITVIPIGFNTDDIDSSLKKQYVSTPQEIAAQLPEKPYNAHKGTNGTPLLVMGCQKMPGAAVMASRGALHAGAGLVSLAFPDAAYAAIAPQLPECLLVPLRSDEYGCFDAANKNYFAKNCNAFKSIAFGCGTAQEKGAEEILLTIFETYEGKLLIDADGINILSRHIDVLNRTNAQILLTPHPGEMSRLTGKSIAEVNANREETAREFAVKHHCTVLLKGANTVIATPDGTTHINPTGNPGMARGGSGDLLTGIIAALLAQGLCVADAARTGAYLHGLCGDIAAQRYSVFSCTVEKMTACLSEAFLRLLQCKD
ncbi:MAG: NAD(P)H-hydrate dehydratase [Clostridia bacterium]|nr:NAD(P)H-hydrate dehydratase [Clostridia bacterium]